MTRYGMANAHLEAWGPFGRGWTLKRFSLEVIGPQAFPVHAYPKAWSPGIEGAPIERDVVYLDVQNEADLAAYQGKLKDQIVIIGAPRSINLAFRASASRFADEDLARAAALPSGTPLSVTGITPQGRGGGGRAGAAGRGGRGGATASAPAAATAPAATTRAGEPQRPPVLATPGIGQRALAMAASEGAALILDCSSQGDSGIIFVASASVPAPGRGGGVATGGSPYSLNAPKIPPQATLATEDFDRIVRMIRLGVKVRMACNFQAEYTTDDPFAYNTIAEIPGTDLKDQIVMIGAHMDSWHSGTGATDNGAGVGGVMEAVRILTALKLQPRRTIRVALWTGEEQGLLGSAAYVREHFTTGAPAANRGAAGGRGRAGAPPTAPATASASAPAAAANGRGPEFEKLSVYFNLDNGGGKIRGIYAQGNDAGAVYFRKWLEPFADLGVRTVTLGTNAQTDHVSFDNAGLPGFGFLQDNLDYLTRTHHSSADVYDRLIADDMKVSSTILAAFLWTAANMDERFPRKPAGRGGAGGRGGRGAGPDAPASTPASNPADATPVSGGQ
jgi:hypothetical protein